MLNYGQDTHANVTFAKLFKIKKTKSPENYSQSASNVPSSYKTLSFYISK